MHSIRVGRSIALALELPRFPVAHPRGRRASRALSLQDTCCSHARPYVPAIKVNVRWLTFHFPSLDVRFDRFTLEIMALPLSRVLKCIPHDFPDDLREKLPLIRPN